MKRNLPSNATISTVLPTLGDADDYVANVRHRMDRAQKEIGAPVTIRIGITGKGMFPAYKIEAVDRSAPPRAFGGQIHRPFTDVELTEENWSDDVMTFEQVTDLLPTLRPRMVRR